MKPVFLVITAAIAIFSSSGSSGVLGSSEATLRKTYADGGVHLETPLGDFAADALRQASGSDFAILCYGELGANLLPGDITPDDVAAAIPVDRDAITVSVSSLELRMLLEALLSSVILDASEHIDVSSMQSGSFPQISGFTVECDASAPAGFRVLSITDENGDKLDPDGAGSDYTLSGSVFVLSGGYGGPDLTMGNNPVSAGTLRPAMSSYITLLGRIMEEPSASRIRILGARAHDLINYIPVPVIILIVILLAVGGSVKMRRAVNHER